jgi:hypothetical protein
MTQCWTIAIRVDVRTDQRLPHSNNICHNPVLLALSQPFSWWCRPLGELATYQPLMFDDKISTILLQQYAQQLDEDGLRS